MQEIGNILTNVLDVSSGLTINYERVTKYYDGTDMTDAKADGKLYLKMKDGSGYVRQVLQGWGENFLNVDTMADLRALDDYNLLLVKAGYYKGITLLGYYSDSKYDTPLNYLWNNTQGVDDGGSVINVGGGSWLAQFNGMVDLRNFGAIPNDYTKTTLNWTALCKANDLGLGVLIEDEFYIKTTQYNINSDNIILTSKNLKGTLIVNQDSNSTWFKLPVTFDCVDITNLTFKSNDGNPKSVRLFVETTKNSFKYIKFSNNVCYTEIGGRLTGLDTDRTFFDYIEISNNKYFNTIGTIWYFVNCDYYQSNIYSNELINMGGNFIYIAYNTNIDYINTTNIFNNKVINDDNYWCKLSTGLYYVFALVEGNDCNYYNNHVEGMHNKGRKIAVYDIYQSTNKGIYRDNLFKNNVSIDTSDLDTGSRALYKAKGGFFKKCYNNTFIIEESYIDKIALLAGENVNKDEIAVNYLSVHPQVESHEIYFYNNTIDVHCLAGDYSYTSPCVVSQINGNVFSFNKLKTPLNGIRYANIGVDRFYQFNNNMIIAKTPIDRPLLPLLSSIGNESDLTDDIYYEVKGNTINDILFREFTFKFKAKSLIIEDNKLNCYKMTDDSDKVNSIIRNTRLSNLNINNNQINLSGVVTYWREMSNLDTYSSYFFGNVNYSVSNDRAIVLSKNQSYILGREDFNYAALYNWKITTPYYEELDISVDLSYKVSNGVKTLYYRDNISGVNYSINVTNDSYMLGNGTTEHVILDVKRSSTSSTTLASVVINKQTDNTITVSLVVSTGQSMKQLTINHKIIKI